MKVFLSWSGERSKAVAEVLRTWLPSVLQSVKPYFSPDDIQKGTRWSTDVAAQLDECQFGIICLTKANLLAPWIHFEAGALTKNLDKGRVIPFLVGVTPADVSGPLSQFQMAAFGLDEIRRVLRAINGHLNEPLEQNVLESTLEMWWPRLESNIAAIPDDVTPATAAKPSRTERQLLEELLDLVRRNTFKDPAAVSWATRPIDLIMLVQQLDLSPSAIDELLKLGITTIDHLCSFTDRDLLKTPNIGRAKLSAIEQALSRIGRSLAPSPVSAGAKLADVTMRALKDAGVDKLPD